VCAARALLLRPESPRVWALVVVATIGLRGLEGGCMVLQAAQQRFPDDPMFVRTMLAGGVCGVVCVCASCRRRVCRGGREVVSAGRHVCGAWGACLHTRAFVQVLCVRGVRGKLGWAFVSGS
jgi:hypothetical protein